MDYSVVIGLEVHVQLLTDTKLFSGCINKFNPDNPNTQTDPVTIGMPGTLPVLNRKAFQYALETGLALNCEIARFTKWDRKQYYYPDLPKAYQISQFDLPFSENGWLEIALDKEGKEIKRIRINRAHLEEDAGKNMHDETGGGGDSHVDLNRAGTPLIEIVSEPDMSSPAEAKAYLEELRLLLSYIGVSDCNMAEGSLRCDANINLHIHGEDGEKIPTPIVEVKNLNSFRNVELACEYEIARQLESYQETGHRLGDVAKETRGWDAIKGISFSQRGKEEAADYRFFPDPDLVPVIVSDEMLQAAQDALCELPAARRQRYQSDYKLSLYDASVIIEKGAEFAGYYEAVANGCGDGKQAANWVTQDVLREMNERETTIDQFPITVEILSALLKKVVDGDLTIKSAREVFMDLLEGAAEECSVAQIDKIIEAKGLAVMKDTGAMEEVIKQVISRNDKAVEDVKAGKMQAAGPLIGQAMKDLKGADPKTVRQMIIDIIQGG